MSKLLVTIISLSIAVIGLAAAPPVPSANPVGFDGTACDLSMSGRKLSAVQVEDLEKKLNHGPGDVEILTRLLGYYMRSAYTHPEIKDKRRQAILWLVKNYPEAGILSLPESYLDMFDPGVAPVKELWLEQTEQNPGNLHILWNAGNSLELIDHVAAEKYLLQGEQLDPKNQSWPDKLGQLYQLTKQPVKALAKFQQAETLCSPEEADAKLQCIANAAFAANDFALATKYAKKMLQAAEHVPKSWNTGNNIFAGNDYLGRIALKQGKIAEAEKYLLAAGKTPGSPQLNSFGPNLQLAADLFNAGKKDTVVLFLEEISKFWKKALCEKAIQKIKAGGNPFLSDHTSFDPFSFRVQY